MCVCMITSCSTWIPRWCHMEPGPNLKFSFSQIILLSLAALIKCIKMFILSSLVVIRYFMSSQCHQLKAEPCQWDCCAGTAWELTAQYFYTECWSPCQIKQLLGHIFFAVSSLEDLLNDPDLSSIIVLHQFIGHKSGGTRFCYSRLNKQWLCSQLHTPIRVLQCTSVQYIYSILWWSNQNMGRAAPNFMVPFCTQQTWHSGSGIKWQFELFATLNCIPEHLCKSPTFFKISFSFKVIFRY